MAAKNRKRDIQLIDRVTEEEKTFIQQKMALLGIRKIAIDGYIINIDYTDVKNHAAQPVYTKMMWRKSKKYCTIFGCQKDACF